MESVSGAWGPIALSDSHPRRTCSLLFCGGRWTLRSWNAIVAKATFLLFSQTQVLLAGKCLWEHRDQRWAVLMMLNKITFHYLGRKGRTERQVDGLLYQPPTSVCLPPRKFSLIMVPGGPCCSLRPTWLPLMWALASQTCYFQLWPQRAVPNYCDLIKSCTEVLPCLFFPRASLEGRGLLFGSLVPLSPGEHKS